MGGNTLLANCRAVVFFDTGCLLCNRSVLFLLKFERHPLCYAGFSSQPARVLLPEKVRLAAQTIVLYEAGRYYCRSRAVLRLVGHLVWYWRWLYLFYLLPPTWADRLYDLVARRRYAWFGRSGRCLIADKTERFFE